MLTKNRINSLINQYLKENRPFVFYRKNNADKVLSFLQKDNVLYTTLNYKESGFVMAPFDNKKSAILFPIEKCEQNSYELPKVEFEDKSIKYIPDSSDSKDFHCKLIRDAINFIDSGKANKVVISRVINKAVSRAHLGEIFLKLLNFYSDAFVYIWYHPAIGLWLGATPEKLLHLNKDRFSTISLAGTQVFSDNIEWNKKEREEQQWVTDFIVDQLLPVVEHLQVSEPVTSKAGHLAHIKSKISGYISDKSNLQNLINKLHPTPAVCGTPRKAARAFIMQHEAYERSFYTGFLGEINLNTVSDLSVNLRCMEIIDETAKIYVGGGITKDSIPEDEWEETVNKSKVLGSLF